MPTALKVISSLEDQLKELEFVSREYESEMEQVIDKLRKDNLAKDSELENRKAIVTKLEIRVDELETEQSYLNNRIETLELENDREVERNVLLEHEIHDLRELSDNKNQPTDTNKRVKRNDNVPLRVSTVGSTLQILPCKNSFRDASNTQLTTSKVVSTTSPGIRRNRSE